METSRAGRRIPRVRAIALAALGTAACGDAARVGDDRGPVDATTDRAITIDVAGETGPDDITVLDAVPPDDAAVDAPHADAPAPRCGAPSDASTRADAGPTHVTATDDGSAVTIANGVVTIRFDERTGLASYAWNGSTMVSGAYASVGLGERGGTYVTSNASDRRHALAAGGATPVDDAYGTGLRVAIDNTAAGSPTIEQVFTVYDGLPYFFVEERVTSPTPIAANYMGAIIVSGGRVTAGAGPDPRVLDVPFDNDRWVRYDARALAGTGTWDGTGYEVLAVYESQSRHGLVVGSTTHDFWKTGAYYRYNGAPGGLDRLNVYGGAHAPDAASLPYGPTYGADGTHDASTTHHAAMHGTTLTSPRMFVGWFSDWRNGLEAFGRANAVVAPPRPWCDGVPFGWLSWGAYGESATGARIRAVSDFVRTSLAPHGFANGGVAYINIDADQAVGSVPDALPDGGVAPDSRAGLDRAIHANGQRAGTYMTPFSGWVTAPGTRCDAATLNGAAPPNVLDDDDGNAIVVACSAQADGVHVHYAIDPTHRLTEEHIRASIARALSEGADYFKLDFLSDGILEGHHADPTASGVQAYNHGMALLTSLIPPEAFVSLSIAPLFPSQYGNSRRISTDVFGQLNDSMEPENNGCAPSPGCSNASGWPHFASTEYMLNSVTYGWWISGTLYDYNDPDGIELYKFANSGCYPASQFPSALPEAWARTRVTASAIAGTVFLDTTDYTEGTGTGRARAMALLTNPRVNAVARLGRPFRPIEGDTGRVAAPICGSRSVSAGSQAADAFVLRDGAAAYLALFNFDLLPDGTVAHQQVTRRIDLTRVGLDASATYRVTDLWSGDATGTARGTLSVALQPGESALLRVEP